MRIGILGTGVVGSATRQQAGRRWSRSHDGLTVCNTDSLGEQIQNAFPQVKVVKALNTLSSMLIARQ